jgi:hypothetical protein
MANIRCAKITTAGEKDVPNLNDIMIWTTNKQTVVPKKGAEMMKASNLYEI